MKKTYFLIGLLFSASAAFCQLHLPRVFADHMVLQREISTRWWGTAKAGEQVSVTINEFAVATKADANGNWELLFPAQMAGGPYVVSIKSGTENIQYTDVYFGDVWVAGGQSNMEWKLNWGVDNWEAEVAACNYPMIRFFEVPNVTEVSPKNDISSGDWQLATPQNAGNFSAVACFFAKRNHLEKNVPVGIIDCNWGGTPAESWISTASLKSVPGYENAAAEMLDPSINWQERMEENARQEALKWQMIGDKESFIKLGAHLPAYDDSKWQNVQLPNADPFTDFVWLRKTVELSKVAAKSRLYLGDINKMCHVYVNGKLVDEEQWMDTTEIVDLPASLLVKGKNVIAIRVLNDWDNKVWVGKSGKMWLESGKQKINLEGSWKYSNDIEPKMPTVERFSWRPGVLFNGMVNPIAGYGIKGAIWYQGESNAGLPHLYRELFSDMITDWRLYWKQGDFPFLFVQLANFMTRYDEPRESDWAKLREAQTQTLSLPGTGMATIIDIGDAKDIHPRNKQDVGYRLWLQARKVAFGESLVVSGPEFLSMKTNGNEITLSFSNVGGGLVAKDGALTGFAIAGDDLKYVWAEAKIVGDQVMVKSDKIANPTHVRYAWADNPACNLYNAEGLPAVPFRTDKD